MSVTYGIEVVPYNDPYITLARDAMHGVAIASIPGTFLVVSPTVLSKTSSSKFLYRFLSGHHPRAEICSQLVPWSHFQT